MSRINAGLVDTSSLRGIAPHVPMEQQRLARRKALLGVESEELGIEQIRQQIETARATTAESQRKARLADEVQQILASDLPETEKYRELRKRDAATADKFRNAFNAEQEKLNPSVQETPTFNVGPAQLDPRGPTGAIATNLDGTGLQTPEISPEARDRAIAMPATPATHIDLNGNAKQLYAQNALQARNVTRADARFKTDEAIRQAAEIAKSRDVEPKVKMIESPIDAPDFGVRKGQPIPESALDNLITQIGMLKRPDTSAQTVTLKDGVFVLNPNGSLGARLGDRPPAQTATGEPLESVIGPDGRAVLMPRSQAAGMTPAPSSQSRPSTDAERSSLRFWERMKAASDDLDATDEVISKLGFFDQGRLKFAPNWLQTETGQLYQQGQRAFTEARLRKDSGAAIPESEFENDRKTYFVQPGDTAAVIAQKKRSRETALNALKRSAARAYIEAYGESPNGPAPNTTAPIVQQNQRTKEYRYSTDGGKTWHNGKPPQ
jgi:hypothetical protein